MAVDTLELALLFTGDDLSEPCPREALAMELCRRIQPGSLAELRARVYGAPGAPAEVMPSGLERALEVAWARWVSERFVGKVPV